MIIGIAAVSRGWTGYLVLMFKGLGVTVPTWTYKLSSHEFNLLSVFVIVAISCIVCLGIKNSAMINNIVISLTILIILFVSGSGFYFADSENWKPFFPFGFNGVFQGASAIFFA